MAVLAIPLSVRPLPQPVGGIGGVAGAKEFLSDCSITDARAVRLCNGVTHVFSIDPFDRHPTAGARSAGSLRGQ